MELWKTGFVFSQLVYIKTLKEVPKHLQQVTSGRKKGETSEENQN